MAETGRARLSFGPDEHCLICNVNIKTPGFSCRNIYVDYDIDHQVESTSSDNHQGALRIRLEQLLQVSLTEALCHSSLVCEACEKKVSQIEDYYRLVAEFESTFYQTARQYGITDQTLEINRLPSKCPWQFPTSKQDSDTKPIDPVNSQNSPGTSDCPVKPVVPKVEESLGDHSETGVSNETSGEVDSCEAGGHQLGHEEDGVRQTPGASGDMERNKSEDQVTQSEKNTPEDGQIKDGGQTEDDGDVRGDGFIGCHGNMACGVLDDAAPENKQTLQHFLTSKQTHQEKLKTPGRNKQKGQQETRKKKLPRKGSLAMRKKSQQSSDCKKHLCSLCQRSFVSEKGWTAHKVKCSKEFEQLNMSLDLDADKPYTCVLCAASFKRKDGLKRHSHTHRNKKQFKCYFCEAKFPDKKSMKDHVTEKHTGGTKAFKCIVCSKAYSHAGTLSKHMDQHTRKHVCSVCDRAFAGSYKLKVHMRIHTGDRPYPCEFCSAAFTQEAYLRDHMKIHDRIKRFLCATCGRQFLYRTTLKQHMAMSHTELRPYKCNHCPKAFPLLRILKEHLQIHTGERPHLCYICGKSFVRPQQLKTHLRIHTGEKPYSCNICGAKFRHQSTLNQHTRSSHCDISFGKGSKKQKKRHAQQEIVEGGSGIGSTGIAASVAVTVESARIVPLVHLSM